MYNSTIATQIQHVLSSKVSVRGRCGMMDSPLKFLLLPVHFKFRICCQSVSHKLNLYCFILLPDDDARVQPRGDRRSVRRDLLPEGRFDHQDDGRLPGGGHLQEGHCQISQKQVKKTHFKVCSVEHEMEGGVVSRTDNSCCSSSYSHFSPHKSTI